MYFAEVAAVGHGQLFVLAVFTQFERAAHVAQDGFRAEIPLPGDDIIGYITKGRGVAIHRKDCPNIKLDDEFLKNRLVEVEWNNPEKSKFEGEVKIIAIDRVGLLNDVIHIVSMEKLSISGINCRVLKDNTANISLLVEVNDISELKQLMKKIKSIPGVDEVSRMRN